MKDFKDFMKTLTANHGELFNKIKKDASDSKGLIDLDRSLLFNLYLLRAYHEWLNAPANAD